MNNHSYYIKKTYQLALNAQAKNNHPFGALLAFNDKIILSSENTVITDKDITKHAELNLISLATRQLDSKTLSQAVIYTSTEPCAMCAGAIFWSGISTVVYGCSAKKLGELTTGSLIIPCEKVFEYGNRATKVIGPILESQGANIHKDYWKRDLIT
jgi:tRNA(Arg) A34 adenosine deaminase TadA